MKNVSFDTDKVATVPFLEHNFRLNSMHRMGGQYRPPRYIYHILQAIGGPLSIRIVVGMSFGTFKSN